MTKKFTKKELKEFEQAKQAIQNLGQIYDGKKANQHDTYIVNHDIAMKELGLRRRTDTEWQLNQSVIKKAERSDPEKKEQWQQALKEGWNKPGVRENKSKSVLEVLARPGSLEAHQERARKNGRKSMRPCVSPEGIFESNRAWAEATGFSRDLFGYRGRKNPKDYYYITQEEYIILTGKDPFND